MVHRFHQTNCYAQRVSAMSDLYHLGFNDRNVDLYVEATEEYDEKKLRTGECKPAKLKVKKSQGYYENHLVRL